MDNAQIARALDEVADVLEIQDANPFRVRAYRNAVRTIEAQTVPLARWVEEGKALSDLPGIGKEMESHIRELLATGSLAVRDELLGQIPKSLLELTRLPGVGPKKARKLFDDLGIATVEALEAAAKAGTIATLPGFGAKTQKKILAGIADYRQARGRTLLADAQRTVEPLLAHLRGVKGIRRLEVAGSYRRRKETIGDVDLLATAPRSGPVMERFLAYPGIESVVGSGDTKSSVILGNGLQVDLRVVPPESYGAALVYFTGSKEHNVKLRRRGVERGLRISEYGVFRVAPDDPEAQGEIIAGAEEEDVYRTVGLPWIPPELREDLGEIEAALAGELPELVELADVRADLHVHSTWSDGKNTIAEMAAACAGKGYEYMVISDHSKALAMTNGLDAKRLRLQWKEIDAVRKAHPKIRILRSLEVDILADGSLDLEDEMLAGLDVVLVSLHSRFELPAAQQTERVLKALEHPEVNVFCHPTARLINRRKPVELDLDAVLTRAAELGVAVELNANPERLDLKDSHLRLAKERGVKLVVSTDAHKIADLETMRFGIDQARRAGLSAKDLLNTLPYKKFAAAIERRAE